MRRSDRLGRPIAAVGRAVKRRTRPLGARHRRSWSLPRLGLLLALVGMVGQLASGAVVGADDATAVQVAALARAAIDCHGTPAGPAPHRHHRAEPSACPLRVALQHPGDTLLPAFVFPAPRVAAAPGPAMLPPARGPPPPTARVGEPRAPPVLT